MAVRAPAPPIYPYSVIAGGVRSKEELQSATRHDPVVAAHYSDFHAGSAHVIRLAAARQAYVSYRVAEHIYWTRKRVALTKGEMLLTDGIHLARARCGNRISENPGSPISPSEPPDEVLDHPVQPRLPEFDPADLPAIPVWPGETTFLLASVPQLGPEIPAVHPAVPILPPLLCCGPGTPRSYSPPPPSGPGPSPIPVPLPQPPSVSPGPPVVAPEPSSFVLLIVGAALLCLAVLRRS